MPEFESDVVSRLMSAAEGQPEAQQTELAGESPPQSDVVQRMLYAAQGPQTFDQNRYERVRRLDEAREQTIGTSESIGSQIQRRLPFYGSGFQIGLNRQATDALRRFADGSATDDDYRRIAERERLQELSGQQTRLERIGETVADLPAFGIEMLATGGVFRTGSAVAQGAVRGIATGAARRGIGLVGGALAQTAANPARIVESATRRQAEVDLGMEPRSFWSALPAGSLDAFTETFTERLGGTRAFRAVGQLPGAALSRIGLGNVTSAIQMGITNRLRRMGIDSPLGELMEERAGELMRGGILGGLMGERDTFGATGELARGNVGRFLDQMFVEGAAFTIYSRGARGLALLTQGTSGSQESAIRARLLPEVQRLITTYGPWEQGGRERYEADVQSRQERQQPDLGEGMPRPAGMAQGTPTAAPGEAGQVIDQDVVQPPQTPAVEPKTPSLREMFQGTDVIESLAGGRRIEIRFDEGRNAIKIDFDKPAGVMSGISKKGVQAGTMALWRSLAKIADRAKAEGLGINFITDKARAAHYLKGLAKRGFEQIGKPESVEGRPSVSQYSLRPKAPKQKIGLTKLMGKYSDKPVQTPTQPTVEPSGKAEAAGRLAARKAAEKANEVVADRLRALEQAAAEAMKPVELTQREEFIISERGWLRDPNNPNVLIRDPNNPGKTHEEIGVGLGYSRRTARSNIQQQEKKALDRLGERVSLHRKMLEEAAKARSEYESNVRDIVRQAEEEGTHVGRLEHADLATSEDVDAVASDRLRKWSEYAEKQDSIQKRMLKEIEDARASGRDIPQERIDEYVAELDRLESTTRRGSAREDAEPEQTPETPQETARPATPASAARSAAELTSEFMADESGHWILPRWLINFFSSRLATQRPAVAISNEPFTTPQDYGELKAIATNPQGLASVPGVSRIFDRRAGADDPVTAAFIARAFLRAQGRSWAAAWSMQQHQAHDLFQADQTGTITLTDGTRGYISDVIEDELESPGSQPLTDAQRTWIKDTWKPLLDSARAALKANGVRTVEGEDVDNFYFPRPAIGKGEFKSKRGTGGISRPGFKAFFRKKRLYPTEQNGVEGYTSDAGVEHSGGMVYDPNAVSRVAKWMIAAYDSIADARLAGDPSLGGVNEAERYEALAADHAQDLARITDKDQRIEFLRELRAQSQNAPLGKLAQVHGAPAFSGQLYPPEIADRINRELEAVPNPLRIAGEISDTSKGIMLTADASVATVQLLPMMFSNPVRFARTVSRAVAALFDPKKMGKILSLPENQRAVNEFIAAGGNFGRAQDMMVAAEEGHTAQKIPGVRQVVKVAARFSQTALDSAKLEMWKAWSPTTPKESWSELAEAIENSLGSGRMEAMGMSANRAILERMLFLAPAYYRGGIGLMATAFQSGVGGRLARRQIGAMVSGVVLVSVAGMLAAGLGWDEIKKRLNPLSGRFLKVPIPMGDGTQIEAGFGHIVLGLSRLVGQSADYWVRDRSINTGTDGNPFFRFLRSKAGMFPGLTIDLATGRNFMGERQSAAMAVAERFIPLAAHHAVPGLSEGTAAQRGGQAVSSFLGLNAFPQGERDLYLRRIDQLAVQRFSRPFGTLSLQEAAQVMRLANREGIVRQRSPAEQIERAIAANRDREQRLMRGVSRDNRARLAEFNRSLPGYETSLAIGGVQVPMTDRQRDAYEALLVEEYDRTIARWDMSRLRRLSPAAQINFIRQSLEQSKERAQRRLRAAWQS